MGPGDRFGVLRKLAADLLCWCWMEILGSEDALVRDLYGPYSSVADSPELDGASYDHGNV